MDSRMVLRQKVHHNRAQVGSLDLNEAIELGKYATELGYDALSAVTPFYYLSNQFHLIPNCLFGNLENLLLLLCIQRGSWG
jgi:hypothetical protein